MQFLPKTYQSYEKSLENLFQSFFEHGLCNLKPWYNRFKEGKKQAKNLEKIFLFILFLMFTFWFWRRANAPTRRRKQAAWIRARSRPSKREIIYARNLSFYQLFSIFFFAITLETLKIENDWAQFWIFTSNHHSSTCQKLNLNKLV